MTNKDWNPQTYLKFNKERLIPSVDLAARINFENPATIIDIGCGPGNSTQVLANKWPNAQILGIDSSPAMIEKAKSDFPDLIWRVADITNATFDQSFDIVFSNATIQWIPNHYALFKNLKSILNPKGTIAIQLPRFYDMPLGKSIDRISKQEPWNQKIGKVSELFTIETTKTYFDYLSELFNEVEIWETHYTHIFESHQAIFDMIHSTGLRPYLHGLTDYSETKEFEQKVYISIQEDYPLQKNGKVLFPFIRQFLIAKN